MRCLLESVIHVEERLRVTPISFLPSFPIVISISATASVMEDSLCPLVVATLTAESSPSS